MLAEPPSTQHDHAQHEVVVAQPVLEDGRPQPAVAALGVLYVARGYVDSSGAPDWAAWLTPIGWLQETRPATRNDPWPLLAQVGAPFVVYTRPADLQTAAFLGEERVALFIARLTKQGADVSRVATPRSPSPTNTTSTSLT